MTMKYILDPMLFALREDISEPDFKLFVRRLIMWDRWLEEHPDDVYVLSDTIECLSAYGCYPSYNVFEPLLRKYHVDYFSAADIVRTINKLQMKAHKIDQCANKRVDDEVIFQRVRIKGGLNQSARTGRMKRALDMLLWCIYCQMQRQTIQRGEFVVFIQGVKGEVSFEVEFDTIEEREGTPEEVRHQVEAKVTSCPSLKDFFADEAMTLRVLRQTKEREDLMLAIRMAIYQQGNLKKVYHAFDHYDFYIQRSFMKDFRNAHYEANESVQKSLMLAMSHTLLNQNMAQREDYRTGKGGNDGQLTRNGFWAWRRFVTRSIKMQYWQKDKNYRFANVKEHDIFVCEWED